MGGFSQIVNKYAIIKQIPIFSKLHWFELHTVVSRSIFLEYKKGEVVYREGEAPDAFFCLVSGRLQAYALLEDGQKENEEFIHRGMFFGVANLLTGENYSLTCEAMNDSLLLRIEKDDFQAILQQIPRLGVEFSESLSRRIKKVSRRFPSVFGSTIISVYSPVKGSGSSAYAINLALSLKKETDKKVILVNINSKVPGISEIPSEVKEASPQWKKEPVDLKEIAEDPDKIINSVSRGDLSIGLLNVVFDPHDHSLVDQISEFVSILANDSHYVVVDLPNDMDDIVFKTLTQSDLIHLVIVDRQKDLEMLKQVLARLKDALKDNFNLDRVQVYVRCLSPQYYLSYEDINGIIEYDVYAILPHIYRQELNAARVTDELVVIIPDSSSEYALAVTTIARRIGEVRVGLVLGGGAALGLSHIGVIRVLEREKIPIDIVVGSSMGALIAGLWTTGKNADQMELIAKEFAKKTGLLKLIDPVFPKAGMIGGRFIKRWLRRYLGNKTFYSTKIPLKIVAYDLVRREEIVYGEGDIVEAVMQSIAIPGVMKPITRGEKMIIDGGVLNPLPTNVLAAIGIKKIISVNVLQSPQDVSRGYDLAQERVRMQEKMSFARAPLHYISVRVKKILKRILFPNISDIVVRTLQATEYLIAEQSASHADIDIHPDSTGIDWYELYKVDDLIKNGEEATVAKLAEIKDLVRQSL